MLCFVVWCVPGLVVGDTVALLGAVAGDVSVPVGRIYPLLASTLRLVRHLTVIESRVVDRRPKQCTKEAFKVHFETCYYLPLCIIIILCKFLEKNI